LQLLISNGARGTTMQAKALIARETLAPRLGVAEEVCDRKGGRGVVHKGGTIKRPSYREPRNEGYVIGRAEKRRWCADFALHNREKGEGSQVRRPQQRQPHYETPWCHQEAEID
jgi:hypothetical protein